MTKTCCPQYPIRCDTSAFKLNKSHKKIIKKVNRFLITGVRSGEKDGSEDGHDRTDHEQAVSDLQRVA